MIHQQADVIVIGGGPAGLAAAVSAKETGAKRIVIIERNTWLGGILPQCIHDGFGVEELGESLTGPEYAERYISRATQLNIETMTETMVLEFTKDLEIIAVNKKGIYHIQAGAIVLAMGCREKTRWHALIPGTRPSGIYTAGVAQGLINLYNIMPGNNVVILGSGDVGLIMARRLTFEGAKVQGVIEILPYASGLPRNVVQCLDDYGIPLFLNHTVVEIGGHERLSHVLVAQVDEHRNMVPGTEKKIPCDTLLLSLGLIPENELTAAVGIALDPTTQGPVVNQDYETSLRGVYSCGNSLQVYDTVDVLASHAQKAGHCAAAFSQGRSNTFKFEKNVCAGKGVTYVVPQKITTYGSIKLTLRAKKPGKKQQLHVKNGETLLFTKKLPYVNPANMIQVTFSLANTMHLSKKDIEVSLQ